MIYIYLLYVVLSAVILSFTSNENAKKWILKFVLVSFIPMIGWLLPIDWSKKVIKNKGDYFNDYMKKQNEDISINLLTTKEKIEREKELNIIPIEEALVISEYATRRKMMLDLLKKNAMQYIDVIKMAVLNDDTETSHFAVAGLMEVKRKLSLSLQTFSVEFEKNPKDLTIAKNYAQVLKEYMKSGFLDGQTLQKYKYTYIQVLEKIIENGGGEPHTFKEKIKVEMELYEYTNAEKTGLQFLHEYSNIEDPYICMLNLYFITKSKSKMQEILDELRNSTIKFSNRTLTIVRYWTGGNEYATKR